MAELSTTKSLSGKTKGRAGASPAEEGSGDGRCQRVYPVLGTLGTQDHWVQIGYRRLGTVFPDPIIISTLNKYFVFNSNLVSHNTIGA